LNKKEKEIDLEDPNRIVVLLTDLAKKLRELNFESLEVDESELEKDLG
jgi:hypothetical protein